MAVVEVIKVRVTIKGVRDRLWVSVRVRFGFGVGLLMTELVLGLGFGVRLELGLCTGEQKSEVVISMEADIRGGKIIPYTRGTHPTPPLPKSPTGCRRRRHANEQSCKRRRATTNKRRCDSHVRLSVRHKNNRHHRVAFVLVEIGPPRGLASLSLTDRSSRSVFLLPFYLFSTITRPCT